MCIKQQFFDLDFQILSEELEVLWKDMKTSLEKEHIRERNAMENLNRGKSLLEYVQLRARKCDEEEKAYSVALQEITEVRSSSNFEYFDNMVKVL